MGFAISTSSHAVVTDDGSYFGTKHARDAFLRIFEQVRRKYKFEVVDYVVMPEHFHILIGEPEKENPSSVLQTLKQTVARRLLKPARRRRSNQPMLWKEGLTVQNRHFGKRAFTISMSIRTRSASRSCATCTETR